MDRPAVERLLQAYVDALASVAGGLAARTAPHEYLAHFDTARNLLARWQGGESEADLKAALEVELGGYRAHPPSGQAAENVGAAFVALCRAVRSE